MPSFPSLDPATGKLRTKHIPEMPVSTGTTSAINAAIAGQVRRALWNGTAYTVGGVVVTSNSRPANIFYDFIGGPDPATLNVGAVNGDTWQDAS